MYYKFKNANIDLHFHPFLDRNPIPRIFRVAKLKGLHGLGPCILDKTVYPRFVEEVEKYYSSIVYHEAGIIIPEEGLFAWNVREYNTRESLHLLTVGSAFDEAHPLTESERIIDYGLEKESLVVLDHALVDNGPTKTAGHISDETRYVLEDICEKYSGDIVLEWNGYCNPFARYLAMHWARRKGHKVEYHNVNKEVVKLSENLSARGFNVPVIADTDVHARAGWLLFAMGKARIKVDVEGDNAYDILQSMKYQIFENKHEVVKKTVDPVHLFFAFAYQVLREDKVYKPRG